MTTQATLVCTCKGVCSGHFRFISSGEATEKMPYNAAQGLMQVRLGSISRVRGSDASRLNVVHFPSLVSDPRGQCRNPVQERQTSLVLLISHEIENPAPPSPAGVMLRSPLSTILWSSLCSSSRCKSRPPIQTLGGRIFAGRRFVP